MKRFFLIGFLIVGNTACSSDELNVHKVETKSTQKHEKNLNLSLEDKTIIQKYKNTIKNLDLTDREKSDKIMKENLSEIKKIKNDHERQKIEMQIYLATDMYQEAYNLNSKMLKDSFSQAGLVTQCELSYFAKRSKDEYEKCYADLALMLESELKITPKNDPEYIYGEWGYLISMYKSGQHEYKNKIEKFIDSTKDETMKFQFKSSYDLAKEQKESYENSK